MKSKIGIIVVTYKPSDKTIVNLDDMLNNFSYNSNTKTVIINNGFSDASVNSFKDKYQNTEILNLEKNLGIGKAQNIGIDYLKDSCEAFLFFDQDSKPQKDFVDLIMVDVDLNKPFIFGPIHQDNESQNFLPVINISKRGLANASILEPTLKKKIKKVDIIISSGMLVSKSVFNAIGMMKASFFIDGVDTEFCLRARANQIPIYVRQDITLVHRIGDGALNFLGIEVYNHSNDRIFYQIRNTILYLKFSHIPKMFATIEIFKVVTNRIILLFKLRFKYAYIKSFICGVIQGIIGLFLKRKYYNDT
jgi:rhamnosyltransferase